MVKYQDLVNAVRDQAGLDGAEPARAAIAAVISTLAHCLPADARARLSSELPGTLDEIAMVPGRTELRDGTELIIEVAQRLGTTPERARYLAQAVLAGLHQTDPRLVDYLRVRLASDMLDVLTTAGEPPRRAASVRADVPTELSDRDIRGALRGLRGWTGDHTGISRTVQLPADRITPLIDRVQREARRMNDHAQVERHPDGVTFTLRTGRAGVVTEPDVWLAERIDDAVLDIGSGGRPGR